MKLLKEMIKLYRKNFRHIDPQSYKFQAEEAGRIQDELAAIKAKEQKFAEFHIEFTHLHDGPESIHHISIEKQCFWLNIMNYMNLRKLCEIQLIKPRLLQNFENYTVWEFFYVSNKIIINGHEISSYEIYHTMLGQCEIDQTVGLCSVFKTKVTPLASLSQDLQKLAVTEPHQFIYFGAFTPVQKMPRLVIFTKENFEE